MSKPWMRHLILHYVNQYFAYGSPAYQYRVDPANAPVVVWHLLLMLRISLMILICGIASHSSRMIRRMSCRLEVGVKRLHIAFPNWSHNNCSIVFRSGLHAGHSIISICLACRWSRMILAYPGSMRVGIQSRQISLNQIMKLWNLGNEIIFRLSAFIYTVYGNQVILIAPLCRANTDESCILTLFTVDPHPVLKTHSGGYNNQKNHSCYLNRKPFFQ